MQSTTNSAAHGAKLRDEIIHNVTADNQDELSKILTVRCFGNVLQANQWPRDKRVCSHPQGCQEWKTSRTC